ncbi:MAG TPA: phytanoyl-CoA dioxygenase family protein [Armatimonadota bacterium]|nr:phytanoyl-CoA dioxygenase family protein [Armatimonadota bacterium]
MTHAVVEESQVVSSVTPEQVRFYEEHGYLKLGRIFTHAEMDALRGHVDRMIAALPEGKRPEDMDAPHFTDPFFFRYLAHPRVLDIIQAFVGPDIALWSSHLIAKPRGNGKAVPWHTDGEYWGSRLQPMSVITLWLAVDESTLENGCMRVVDGSHREAAGGMGRYREVDAGRNVFGSGIPEETLDPSRVVDLELQPGECHFHAAFTVHGSNPNFSEKRRCGYTMRYMPASVVHDDQGHGWKVYLLRGQDRTGGRTLYTPVPEYLP